MSNRSVYVDGAKVTLAPAALLGQGGEAEVYDLHDGRVLKWWKPADHPDFEGMPDAQVAATKRIAEAPAKLRALPGALPSAVVAPCGLALAKKNGAVAGYLMPKVAGTALHAYGEPKWRRDHPVAGGDVIAALLALHDAISGLHRAGIVVGDCNDLNVLVEGRAVHLIDVDSYQFAGFACSMFSERFVDPRLCDPQMVLSRAHDRESDWFAFAAMAFRSLLGVGPWGGVHPRCTTGARPARRLSVLDTEVIYPRAARPIAVLPDELVAVFRGIFERDVRGVFPRGELERLRMNACVVCGEEHARARCPGCQTRAHVPPIASHGRLRWQLLAQRPEVATQVVQTDLLAAAAQHANPLVPAVWIAGDALMRSAVASGASSGRGRAGDLFGLGPSAGGSSAAASGASSGRGRAGDLFGLGPSAGGSSAVASGASSGRGRAGDLFGLGPSAGGSSAVASGASSGRGRAGDLFGLGPERIGSVLAGQTRAWVGAKLGVGFYRAGGFAVGFVFRPDRGTLDDRVKLPKLRGELVDAYAIIGDDRAWLFLTLVEAGKLVTTCVVIGADASVLATEQLHDRAWLAGAAGACAAGAQLFVPTDDGIARIDIEQGAIVHTRTFPETAPLVGAGDVLSLFPGGIAVARKRDAVLLQLS